MLWPKLVAVSMEDPSLILILDPDPQMNAWGFGQHLLLSLNIQDPSNQALIGLGFTSPKYIGSE